MDLLKKIAAQRAKDAAVGKSNEIPFVPLTKSTRSDAVASKGVMVTPPVTAKVVANPKAVVSPDAVGSSNTGVASVSISLSKPGVKPLSSNQQVKPPASGLKLATGLQTHVAPAKPIGSQISATPLQGVAKQAGPTVNQTNSAGNTSTVGRMAQPAAQNTKPVEAHQPELEVKLDTFSEGVEKYTEEEVQTIKENLEFIENNLESPEIVGESVKIIMMSMLENPNLEPLLEHKDIGLMVRGLRAAYGVHVAKAETRKAGGPGSRGGKGKSKGPSLDIDLDIGAIFGGGSLLG